MGAMMPGALAPTSRDFDWVCNMLVTCKSSAKAQDFGSIATNPQNIMQWNMLGNSNDERDLCLNGILNGFATMRRGNEHSSSIRFQLLFRLSQIRQEWES